MGMLVLVALTFFFIRDTGKLPTRQVTVVAFGDSLTEGYGVGDTENYPYLLDRALSATPPLRVTVQNKGVSGNTTRNALDRVGEVIQAKPDVVIIGIGGNDILRKIPPTETKANLTAIIEQISSKTQARIILLEVDVPLRSQYKDIYHELAKTYNLTLTPFFYPSLALSNTYTQDDRIHLTKAGYQKVVDDYIYPAVIKELKKI